jgi:hypothetical protein
MCKNNLLLLGDTSVSTNVLVPPLRDLGGVCFSFLSFLWISFQKIQKLNGPKSKKMRSSWKGASNFSLLEPSSFLSPES